MQTKITSPLPKANSFRAVPSLGLTVALLVAFQPDNVGASVHYVDASSAAPAPPYTSWATAATSIQDAVDAAVAGGEVLVTNGIYATGGRMISGAITTRVLVDKALTVRSVNGPQYTIIQGYQVPGTTNGDGAIRCVYLTNGASLLGFTLTRGATGTNGYSGLSGGGLLCESTDATVSNCLIIHNSAFSSGGGAVSGRLIDCELSGNSATAPYAYGSAADGGGAVHSMLDHCTIRDNSATGDGGGAYGGTLDNCTLTGNSAAGSGGGAFGALLDHCSLAGNSAGSYGGGAAGEGPTYACRLGNCILTGNSAYSGGGASHATLNNCAISGNSALFGGGHVWSTLTNCTVTGNMAQRIGGGAFNDVLVNCIIYFNVAGIDANYSSGRGALSSLDHCCTTPQPADGVGNFSLDPQLASPWHLSAASPCRGAGLASCMTGSDIDGEPWTTLPSVGCDEYHSGTLTGALSVEIKAGFTNVAVGYPVELTASILGRTSASLWEFGDGIMATNQPFVTHVWEVPGDYAVEFTAYNESYPGGASATVTVHVAAQPVHYVSADSPNPSPPYASWAAAAKSIQDAVDAATVPGALVLVSNGVYATGGRAIHGTMTNRVAVDKPLTLRSVSGPEVTLIQGYQVPGVTNGEGAIRCVYFTKGASLVGFSLTNGATQATGDWNNQRSGGGLWCESAITIVSNCVVAGNSASLYAGGAYSGSLTNCILVGNISAQGAGATLASLDGCVVATNTAVVAGGGVLSSVLRDCTVSGNRAGAYGGGGAYDCTLENCTVAANLTADDGGGVSGGRLQSCKLIGNEADGSGGGAYAAWLENCTLRGNTASNGGGARGGTLSNCFIAFNSASDGGGVAGAALKRCILAGNSARNAGGGAGMGWPDPGRPRFGFPSSLQECTVTNNTGCLGGGVFGGTLNNCLLVGNSATGFGGGACASDGTVVGSGWDLVVLNNCTLVGNTAQSAGGVFQGAANNCIIYSNSAAANANYDSGILNYCCTLPFPDGGSANITNAPLFADQPGGYMRLQSNSPCINSGFNAFTEGQGDLDGNLRIINGTVDIGAYEYQGAGSSISYAWLQHFVLPTDGTADHTDLDADGHDNWQEWRCQTSPTNAASVLRLLSTSRAGENVTLVWQSVAGVNYFLERSTNLGAAGPFTPVVTDVPGQPGITTYTDADTAGASHFFYRVGVGLLP